MSFTAEGTRVRQKAHIDADEPGLDRLFVEFDVSENETHESTAKATSHPVESGAEISDHIQQDPDTLDLQVVVSNTPILSEIEASVLTPNRAEDAYNVLRNIKETGRLVTVFTTLREYTNMAIVRISVTRNAPKGDVAAMSLRLQHIRTATSETIDAPTPSVSRGQKTQDGGKKALTEASEAVDEKSQTILETIARRIGI